MGATHEQALAGDILKYQKIPKGIEVVCTTQCQVNVRLPVNLEAAAEKYAKAYGFRNVQELISAALREKIFHKDQRDREFTEKQLELIDKIIERTLASRKLVGEKEIMKALR